MKTILIMTDAHPRDDPRTSFWGTSFDERGFRSTTEIYTGTCLKRQVVKKVDENKIDYHETETRLAKSIGEQYLQRAVYGSESELLKKLIVDLRQQLSTNSTVGHQQLVRKCLDMLAFGIHLSQNPSDICVGLDLQGAIGALAFSAEGNYEVVTVYDAQEVVTAGLAGLTKNEIEFWLTTEKIVLNEMTHTVTVSPGLASWYNTKFLIQPAVIPNFEPLSKRRFSQSDAKETRYVYFGGCDESKGLDPLIQTWPLGNPNATLVVIAENSPDRQRLQAIVESRGGNEASINFTSHEDSRNIIEKLSEYDVGVIPYQMKYPYSEASPNKFGQYLAAGLAVLTPRSGFVSDVVENHQLGLVLPEFTPQSSEIAVEYFSNMKVLDFHKKNVREKFDQELNWDSSFQNWISAALGEHQVLNDRGTMNAGGGRHQRKNIVDESFRRAVKDYLLDAKHAGLNKIVSFLVGISLLSKGVSAVERIASRNQFVSDLATRIKKYLMRF